MFVCMYVCVYACVHVCIRACMYVLDNWLFLNKKPSHIPWIGGHSFWATFTRLRELSMLDRLLPPTVLTNRSSSALYYSTWLSNIFSLNRRALFLRYLHPSSGNTKWPNEPVNVLCCSLPKKLVRCVCVCVFVCVCVCVLGFYAVATLFQSYNGGHTVPGQA